MSFEVHGFMGSAAVKIAEHNAARFADYFKYAATMNERAHFLLRDIQSFIRPNNPLHLAVTTLYIRSLTSFAASLLLMKAGLGIEAGSITRTLVETGIYLRKINLDRSWVNTYIRESSILKLQQLEIAVKHSIMSQADRDTYLEQNPEHLENKRLLIEEKNRKRLETREAGEASGNRGGKGKRRKKKAKGYRATSVEELASSIGAINIYDFVYRELSNSNSHALVESLTSYLERTPEGSLRSILYGNKNEDTIRLLVACNWAMWASTDSLSSVFQRNFDWGPEVEALHKELFVDHAEYSAG